MMGIEKVFLVGVAIFFISFFSISNGGIGLLSRPVLIFIGFAPNISIGSYRISNLISKVVGLVSSVQKGEPLSLEWRRFVVLFLPSFIGGVIGVEVIRRMDADVLKIVLAILILLMGVLLFFNREFPLTQEMAPASDARKIAGFFGAVLIGTVATFIGGSGILLAYLMLFQHNKAYLRSILSRKIANFGSALSSGILFMYYGIVDWQLVLLIVLAGALGEYFGTKFPLKISEKRLRAVALMAVFVTGIVLLFI
jgi:uncharacterized protein